MDTVENIFISSRIVYLILIPCLRELAGVLLAFAISKDCKARDNGSSALWGLLSLIMPAFSGLVYLVYSRFLTHRKPDTAKDKELVKRSRKLTFWSIIVYIFAVILSVICIITSTATGVALFLKDADQQAIYSEQYES